MLPAHLSIAKAKQISDEKDLYFQSEYSPLSNFFACPIYDENDTCYNSAEQQFQHKKALHHDYLFTANKIMLTWDPYELKRLGNLIPASQSWLQEEEAIMSTILRAKFTQNPSLASILIATGQLHLHEANADSKWSAGAELSSKATLNGQWGGADTMGSFLEALRSELSGDPDTLPPLSESPLSEGDDLTPMSDKENEDEDDNITCDKPASPLLPPTSMSPSPKHSQAVQTTTDHYSPTNPQTPRPPPPLLYHPLRAKSNH